MKEDTYKLYIINFLLNATTIICFTILSIVFNKWWIIFFTAIFWSTFKIETKIKDSD